MFLSLDSLFPLDKAKAHEPGVHRIKQKMIPSTSVNPADFFFGKRQFVQNHCRIYVFENIKFIIGFITPQRHNQACSCKKKNKIMFLNRNFKLCASANTTKLLKKTPSGKSLCAPVESSLRLTRTIALGKGLVSCSDNGVIIPILISINLLRASL